MAADSIRHAFFDQLELGCGVVYSEDMNDGQKYGGVRVVNPFK